MLYDIQLDFGAAIQALKSGKKVARKGWGGYWFLANHPHCEDELAGGYVRGFDFKNGLIVAVLNDQGGCAPATAYQEDMLAEDWEVIE